MRKAMNTGPMRVHNSNLFASSLISGPVANYRIELPSVLVNNFIQVVCTHLICIKSTIIYGCVHWTRFPGCYMYDNTHSWFKVIGDGT